MQDRYVGDIGDFGKYALLRALSPGFRLGVAWYWTPDESHNADGKHIRYLLDDRIRPYAPFLFDELKHIVETGRSIGSIEASRILPSDTIYHNDPTSALARKIWSRNMVETLEPCDLIYLDPDNGISERLTRKHALYDELTALAGNHRGNTARSLVIYHHLGRNGTAQQQIERIAKTIESKLGIFPLALRFRKGSPRVFFIAPNKQHFLTLSRRTKEFLDEWHGFFSE